MASRQEKMERAEAAAKLAADDLKDVTREVKISTGPTRQQQEDRPGVIGSVVRAVQGTYEQAKESVVGKSHEAAESTREGAAIASGKAGEYKDYVADKTKEAMNKTAQKTGEYKDAAAEKTVGYKDITVEKAKEGKDATVSKLGELKDSAVDGAKRAMSYLSGKKEETETTSLGYDAGKSGGIAGRKVAEIDVEETGTGKVAATLKATDQMAGQAFNDVGPLDGGWEGKSTRGG